MEYNSGKRCLGGRLLYWVMVLAIGLVAFQRPAVGEYYYVRPGGGDYGREDGADWANAFDGLPARDSDLWGIGNGIIGPGDTVFLAGGVYRRMWEPGSGGSSENARLTIRRATAGQHGTQVGWNAGFDSQVVLDNESIRIWDDDYITIDGGVYDGIKVRIEDSRSSDIRSIGIELAPGNSHPSNHIILRNIEVEGPGRQKNGETRGIQSCLGDYLMIEDCHIHHIGSALYLGGFKTTVQDSYIHDIDAAGEPNDVHENVLFICGGSDGLFRWNVVHDATAVGVFTRYGGDRWQIYGNLFMRSAQAILIDNRGGDNDILVYNNTFISCIIPLRFMSGASGKVINNLFYWVSGDGASGPIFGDADHDYNWYSDSDPYGEFNGVGGWIEDPFGIEQEGDYHLKPSSTAIDQGLPLGLPYDLDADGNPRGQDGYWDIGAYEYPGESDMEAPSRPASMDVEAISFNRIELKWPASTDNKKVWEYIVFRQGVELVRVASNEYDDIGLTDSTPYRYYVQAVDVAGNESLPSPEAEATTLPPDEESPALPQGLRVLGKTAYNVELAWEKSNDNQYVAGYVIYRDDQSVGVTADSHYRDAGLEEKTAYRYYVAAIDDANNESAFSEEILVATISAPSLNDDLVAAYTCDEGLGSVLTDWSQYRNDGGIEMDAEKCWRTGLYGWALEFNGQDDIVEIMSSPSLDLVDGLTLAAWVYPTSYLAGWQHLIAKQHGSLLSFYLAANSQYDTPRSGFNINDVWQSTGGESPLVPGVWTHVASTYDGQELHLYVNGEKVSQVTVNSLIESSGDPIYIGGNVNREYFKGRIDEIRIYSRPMQGEEIRALMNTPIFNNLTGASYWLLCQ